MARSLPFHGHETTTDRARVPGFRFRPEKTQEGGLLESLGPDAATLLKQAIPGTTSLTLHSGFSVPYACQILKPEAQAVPSKQHERELSWFRPGDARKDALPAIITPSEAPKATAAAGTVSWNAEGYCGSQILIRGGDAKELGSIYHAMVAWACSNPGILDNEQAISDFLARQSSPLAYDAGALRISLKALFSWISSTWPGSDLCAEYPVSARLDNGQRVVGRIDLLIRTADGLVVMDHKLAGNSDGKVEEIVATWVPQLALYATAIARISGNPLVGTWLNLPLEGSAVRVSGAV
ncbi:MAG: PD-(D/E)XK nuclease family protein [Chloroflexi bacterium]|nr:PD-(D/E)XK nuclease family protein [Chloroflexota bacterium]